MGLFDRSIVECESLYREHTARASQNLDLIVFLPLDHTLDVPDDEFPKLRQSADHRLSAILIDDEFGIISPGNAVVVEANGSITQRLRTLEEALTSSV